MIYRCPITSNESCYPYVFDNSPNRDSGNDAYTYNTEKRDHQWMGAAMDGGPGDNDKLIVCAPRFIAPTPSDYLMHGNCYYVENTLDQQPVNVTRISDLRYINAQLQEINGTRYFYYMYGEEGLSVHVSSDNSEFLIGAPGIFTWKGSVIRWHATDDGDGPSLSRRDLESQAQLKETEEGEKQAVIMRGDILNNAEQDDDSYFGYSVASGYFDASDPSKLLYVATAPQGDAQQGIAYVFEAIGTKIINRYYLKGEQFGEYFGYAVLAADLNGDGLTDIIVSAPQYSSAGTHDEGAIYTFMHTGRVGDFFFFNFLFWRFL